MSERSAAGSDEWVQATFPEIDLPPVSAFQSGGIIGRATIIDCVQDSDSPWFVGRYGFLLANAEPLPLIPCRGMLGFFRPTISEVPNG